MGEKNLITNVDVAGLPRLVLASKSPRRKELLQGAGLNFCCLASDVDEEVEPCKNAEEYVVAVASKKAYAALNMLAGNLGQCALLACDTVVVVGGEGDVVETSREPAVSQCDAQLTGSPEQILGKPIDSQDAKRMLKLLSGNTHRVISGVSILKGSLDTNSDGNANVAANNPKDIPELPNILKTTFAQTTYVTFRALDDLEIDKYIQTGEPFDKAGAYGIQGAAGKFVESIEGDYNNVVGLPLLKTLDVLSKIYACKDLNKQNNMHQNPDASNKPKFDDSPKPYVRKQLKAIRQAIPQTARAAASQEVCKNLMHTPEFENARVIAAFCSFGSELCFDYMAQHMPKNKIFAVPITMANHKMEFVKIEPTEILPQNRTLPFITDPAGITSIPDDAQVIDAKDIDLMLVPGLGFDDHGYRIGYGGGYYDVYMKRAGFKAACFGAFFEEQHYFGELPCNCDDVPLDAVVTQNGVLRFK